MQNGIDPSQMTHELLMKEVALSLNQRRQLIDNAKKLETEMVDLTGPVQEKPKHSMEPCFQREPPVPPPVASPAANIALVKNTGSKQSPPKPTSSPRKQRQDVGRVSKKEKPQENAVETFDSRLKSIITNALIGESNSDTTCASTFTHTNSVPVSSECSMTALRSRLDVSLGVPSPNKGILTGKHVNKEGLNLHQVLAGPSNCERSRSSMCTPPMPHIDYTQISPAKMALKKHFSQDPVPRESSTPEEGRKGSTGNSLPNLMSIPVKISLNEVSTKSKTTSASLPLSNSLPVSLPLTGAQEGGSGAPPPHVLSNQEAHHMHHHHRSSHKPEEGKIRQSHSPVIREAYSPISRPSSSSSTASAESVRHLSHGAHCVSPRSNSSFNLDGTVSENSRSPGRAGQPTPPFSVPSMIGPQSKESHYSQALAMQHGKPSALAGYPGYPQMAHLLGMERGVSPRFGLPGGGREQKEAASAASAATFPPPELSPGCTKQPVSLVNSITFSTSSTTSSTAHHPLYRFPPAINGLTKAAAPTALPTDEKPRRGRRKRQISKSPSSMPPGKKAAPTPPPTLIDADGKMRPAPRPISKSSTHGAEDIDIIVSNASKPLAITAISDAESSAKSSPLANSSPRKPHIGPPQREVPGQYQNIVVKVHNMAFKFGQEGPEYIFFLLGIASLLRK